MFFRWFYVLLKFICGIYSKQFLAMLIDTCSKALREARVFLLHYYSSRVQKVGSIRLVCPNMAPRQMQLKDSEGSMEWKQRNKTRYVPVLSVYSVNTAIQILHCMITCTFCSPQVHMMTCKGFKALIRQIVE